MTRRVYLVEDHPLMRRILREAIEKLPELVVCGMAATAEEAISALDGLEVDMVLVDLSLPQMSGIEFIRMLRERHPNLPCLILSGHQEASYVQQALTAGAWGYILKGDPYEIKTAIDAVAVGDRYVSKVLRPLGGNQFT